MPDFDDQTTFFIRNLTSHESETENVYLGVSCQTALIPFTYYVNIIFLPIDTFICNNTTDIRWLPLQNELHGGSLLWIDPY